MIWRGNERRYSHCSNNGKNPLIQTIEDYLLENDWDVIGYNSTNAYNERIRTLKKNIEYLPENKTIICVGNSKKLWKKAKILLDKGVQHPFDQVLTPEAVNSCTQICQNYEIQCLSYLSHSSQPFLVSFQDLAVSTNIGFYSQKLQLVIHSKFGPWFALRFALLLDCNCSYQSISSSPPPVNNDNTINVNMTEEYNPHRHITARKSFPIGQDEMYCNEQIAYHYKIPYDQIFPTQQTNKQTKD